MKTLIAGIIVSMLLVSWPTHAGDRVVARVGSEAITHRELTEAIAQNPDLTRKRILELLIERRLLLAWASERNITVGDAEIEETISSIRDRNKMNPEQFEKAIEARGETVEMFRASIREQLTINKALGMALSEKVQISEEELQELYLRTYPSSTVYRVSHILLTTDESAPAEEETRVREKAVEILAEITTGASFDDMARKYSQDSSSADEGGHLGAFSEGELLPELENLAADLEPGEVGGPVRTSAGYHILLLESKELKEPPPLAEVRTSLERSLMAQKEESVRTEWLKKLKETTYIEVFPDDG